MQVLSKDEWLPRAKAHSARAGEVTSAHLERRSRHERHPVEDFLFDYYPVRPSALRRWMPGIGVALKDAVVDGDPHPLLGWSRDLVVEGDVVKLDLSAFLERRGRSVLYIRDLLAATDGRAGKFGCFGMHEWAMVYKTDNPRHPEPLRLGQAGTDAVVESHDIACTHFDAFRFFTDSARPLNRIRPTRERQPELEQPGCLHANMDLYKWASKLGPLIPGELWLDCMDLAMAVRRLDMAASPYDLRQWGVEPVPVETTDGKAEYVRRQREFADRAEPLRRALIEHASAALSFRYPATMNKE